MEDNKNAEDAKAKSSDHGAIGGPGGWVCIGRTSNEAEGWMTSRKRLSVPGGFLFQVSTEHRDPETGLVVACAEALAFVPT